MVVNLIGEVTSPEKSAVVSRIFIRGGRRGHLKAITRTPARVWGRQPRMVTKLKIIKQLKVLENESIFQKYQHFPGKSIFLRKISKN